MEYFIFFLVIIIVILIFLLVKKYQQLDSIAQRNNSHKEESYQNEIKGLRAEIQNLRLLANSNKEQQPLVQSQTASTITQSNIDELAKKIGQQKFEVWKKEYEEKVRADAAIRSKGQLLGSIDAQMMPLLGIGHFPGKFYEARFIGSPITYVVFKNLDDDTKDLEIIFVEVTTKNVLKAGRVRRAIASGNIKFVAIDKKN